MGKAKGTQSSYQPKGKKVKKLKCQWASARDQGDADKFLEPPEEILQPLTQQQPLATITASLKARDQYRWEDSGGVSSCCSDPAVTT